MIGYSNPAEFSAALRAAGWPCGPVPDASDSDSVGQSDRAQGRNGAKLLKTAPETGERGGIRTPDPMIKSQ
jgi:hypothetical protein